MSSDTVSGIAREGFDNPVDITTADVWQELDKYLTVLPPIEATDVPKEMVMEHYGVSERQALKTMQLIAKDGVFDCIQVRSGKGQKQWVLRRKAPAG